MRNWIDILEQEDRRRGNDRRATEREDGAERRMASNLKKQQENNLLRDLQKREDDRRHKAANKAARDWDEMGKQARARKETDPRDEKQIARDNAAVGDWMSRFEKARKE